ncbi:MAG TPA: hypothetical protein VF669_16855 [Tepidisphaeraceae bacterium]|jgi:hypothetical protein
MGRWLAVVVVMVGVGIGWSRGADPETIEVQAAETEPVRDPQPVSETQPAATSQPAAAAPALASAVEAPAVSAEDRELLELVYRGVGAFRKVIETSPTAALEEKIEPLLETADQLRERANLKINNLTLCESVERFGVYEPLAPATFPARKDSQAIVYFEVENFRSVQGAEGVWQTKLQYELSVYPADRASQPVYSKPATPVVDVCRSRRRDFFLADKITLPKKLEAGKYTLKITLTDTQAHRVGEGTLSLEIAGH